MCMTNEAAAIKLAERDNLVGELVEALEKAADFIENIRQELHGRRVADWYPEGAHNAAVQMSDDMRLLGNQCADFDVSAVIAKAREGAQS
ncbi:hypothetical protein LMG19089_02916 [Ralstonia edaphis]|uniref:hypothetical protein n=1 Tax=Ralstonia edaphi TaxID=3058599 RepID=UPI0028F4FE92|nr:hypothetical protein [Ralstonia sp. LMG 6871]CAJ0701744.1 hypothetical protein LMG19089_02916 [Ralstonia sp. LMG 6871]